jgi:segregation and condensation protein B
MALKAKIEAIIYAAEEPITVEQISMLVKDMVLAEEAAAKALASSIADGTTASEASLEGADQADFVVDESIPEAQPSAPETQEATAEVAAPDQTPAKKRKGEKKELSEDARIRAYLRPILEELVADYQQEDRGIEIRQIAGGYKMATKPEHHDVVRAFAKSLKPPVRLSLAALETLAVIAYKQPVTVPEISEIRGVEAAGVIGTLLDRKLVTTAGRKQVIGRPILYKTTKDFLMRFGLNEISELPSMEEFEKLASDGQADLFPAPTQEATAPTEAEQEQKQEDAAERHDAIEADASANVEEHENSTAGNS